jgi:nucleoside-triphosphatase
MPVRLLVEGRPGSGKTTVVARLADLLAGRGLQIRGFVTHEVRERGRRVGFEIETVDGDRATLAHVSLPGPPRVGRYGVDLEAFERVALPAFAGSSRNDVVLIDELGKMELASDRFREAIARLLDTPVDVVATIHVFRNPFTDQLKRRPDVELVRVTRVTRDELPDQFAARLSRPSVAG